MPPSPDAPSNPRIVLLDGGLFRRAGHHVHFGQGLAQLCAKENIPLIALTAKSLEPDLATDLASPKAAFTRTIYQPVAGGDMFDRVWNDYRAGQRLYATDLDQSGLEPQATDLLWIPAAHPREISGLADWLMKHSARPQVALGFHSVLRPVEPGGVEGLVHRLAARHLVAAVGAERIFPYATNHKLAQRLATAMNLGIYLAPLPLFYGPSATAGKRPALPPGKGPLVACLGEPRPGKIGLRLVEVVQEALRRRPDFRFLFQVADDGADPALAALEKMPQVTLVRGWIDDDSFVALIQAADMLLLPYQRHRYDERVSGPFAFAAAHGRPSIVPSDTWMAERITNKHAAGIVYKRDEAVVEALALAAERLPELNTQAAGLKQSWRVWDGEALLRAVRQWAAGDGTDEIRRVDPQLPSEAPAAGSA